MISSQLVAASSQPLVLSILARGESYGYAIIQEVRELSEESLRWTDGMLYPVLHRLEKRGEIRGRWKRAPTGRRRRYYRLTPRGEAGLERHREEWTAVSNTLARLWRNKPCST